MFDYIFNQYEQIKEDKIVQRRIDTKTWNELLNQWKSSPYLEVTEIGKSYEGEGIHQVKWGNGPIKIAAWSQMHGNEATATMALCDIYTFLSKSKGLTEELWQKLHQNITLYSIPQLNKDGAKYWQRETALGIDMNRDAQTMFTQEAKLLSDWADAIQPEYAFNLHDQNRLYSAGNSKYQTQIALLATAADEDSSWTHSRIRAGKLANHLTKSLKKYIGNHLAKWTDEFEKRAFGDTFQQRGYGLILFEAGGMQWDLEKTYLRKITACMLLDSFYQIATQQLEKENLEDYNSLPTNEKSIADIKIINAPITPEGSQRADLLFNIKETAVANNQINFTWILEDLGDMSNVFGLTEINGTKLSLDNKYKVIKEKEYKEFILTKEQEIIFKLSDYTNKINN